MVGVDRSERDRVRVVSRIVLTDSKTGLGKRSRKGQFLSKVRKTKKKPSVNDELEEIVD